MIYTQLDENSIVIGVSNLSNEVIQDNMIEIEEFDETLLGKKYNNGIFEEVETIEEETEA